MVGLIKPTAGRLLYDGADIGAMDEAAFRPLRAKIQMIFQDPQSSLNPRLTLGSILARPLEAFGKFGDAAGRRKRAGELLEIVGLPAAFLDRYPHELSGGQRQRVGIARALALEPEFIVADEIVSGLDVSTQAQILLLLRRLRADFNLTLVFISHDLSVVRVLCDEVAVLSAGEIVEKGATASVFADPQHPYTRELLDCVPLPDVEDGWIMREKIWRRPRASPPSSVRRRAARPSHRAAPLRAGAGSSRRRRGDVREAAARRAPCRTSLRRAHACRCSP